MSGKILLSRRINFREKPNFLTSTALREKWTVVHRNLTSRFAANALHATTEAIWIRRLFFFTKTKLWISFLTLNGERPKFSQIFLPRGVKPELYVSRRTFWKKNVSARSYNFFYLFMVLLRTCWLDVKLHGRQEGILRDQLKVSGKNFWEKPKIPKFCEMSENFQFFCETVLAELSKPHSMCPEKHLEKNELFLEKIWLWIHFLILGEKILFLG